MRWKIEPLVEQRQHDDQKLTVAVRHASGQQSPTEILGREIRDILSEPTLFTESETHEIFFSKYVAFLISDEFLHSEDDSAIFEGKTFRKYKKSRFLEFIDKSYALPADMRPKPFFHYGIYCLDDLVDVVTPVPPEIRYIGMTGR